MNSRASKKSIVAKLPPVELKLNDDNDDCDYSIHGIVDRMRDSFINDCVERHGYVGVGKLLAAMALREYMQREVERMSRDRCTDDHYSASVPPNES